MLINSLICVCLFWGGVYLVFFFSVLLSVPPRASAPSDHPLFTGKHEFLPIIVPNEAFSLKFECQEIILLWGITVPP